jgi:hypothetical protein
MTKLDSSYSELYADFMNPQYKTWLDRGGNLGVQCLECGKTFWTGGEAPMCANCQLIQSQNILQIERTNYIPDEENPIPSSQPPQLDDQGNVV